MKIPSLSSVFRRDVDPSRYRLEIDGLRFFAIMIVMVGHLLERIESFWLRPNAQLDSATINGFIDLFARANQGVLLFFAISGFIISKQMQDIPDGQFSGAFVGKYYVRRITRIFPPYYVILLSTFILFAVIGFRPGGLNGTFVRDVPFGQSLAASLAYSHGLLFSSMPRLFPLGWSLEVEVQFYLFAPLVFLLFFRGASRSAPWRFAVLLITAFLISFAAVNKLIPVNSFTLASYAVYFAMGIALSRYEDQVQSAFAAIGSRASAVLGFGAVLILFWVGDTDFGPLLFTLIYWFFSLGSIFVLFGLAFQPTTVFGKFCRIPIITYIGLACYSLYLVHLQVFHIATFAVGKLLPMSYLLMVPGFVLIMLLGLLAGAAFFVLVEKPFASWRPLSTRKTKSAE